MFFRKTTSLISVGILILLASPLTAHSAENIKVLATFSILGDMVKRIGGRHIDVTTLVGPDGDTHVYRPTPAAAKAMSEANLIVVNGLGFEGWLDRLVEASGFDGSRLVATKGIRAISYEEGEAHDEHSKDEHSKDEHSKDEHSKDEHSKDEHSKDEHHDDHAGHNHGAFDPHAWQSIANAEIYIDNITAALSKIDPDNASTFYQNHAAYITEIKRLDKQVREMVASLPQNRRTVVTSHDAFQYFGRDYGLTFLAPQGLSTESEASAQDVASLIKQMRAKRISAVFIENITDPRLIKQIAKETGATLGGTLYPGALSGLNGPASTYLKMIRHNATMLTRALGS
jgi:zinc/manganese transport system substrate-binding protein